LAVVARPHGVRGELRLKLHNPDSEVLLRKPAIRLALPDGTHRPGKLRAARKVPGALLVQLEGVSDRDMADAMRGVQLEVSREVLDAPDEDEFYVCDLEGCDAMLEGRVYGRIKTVVNYPTCDALVIDKADGGRIEVPLAAAHVGAIDLEAGTLELLSIDGLE
jgi:16S rRNA processing protein RimM